MTTIGFDCGFGNIKLYGPNGPVVFPSAIAATTALRDRNQPARTMGLRASKRAMFVQSDLGDFAVGQYAHDYGRPIENMDFDRLAGSPEMMAFFMAALAGHGVPAEPLDVIVGLPLESLRQGNGLISAIKSALSDKPLVWRMGQNARSAERLEAVVRSVSITSQPVGAMFDYLLDDEGHMRADKREQFKGEIGILGVGMSTVDLLVVRDGAPVQRFTAGEKLGVRRLLALADGEGPYSIAEMDMRLRDRSLDTSRALPLWASKVQGYVEQQWGDVWRRFNAVVAVGGGVALLQRQVERWCGGRVWVPDDPIIATARGLYKFGLMRQRRK